MGHPSPGQSFSHGAVLGVLVRIRQKKHRKPAKVLGFWVTKYQGLEIHAQEKWSLCDSRGLSDLCLLHLLRVELTQSIAEV